MFPPVLRQSLFATFALAAMAQTVAAGASGWDGDDKSGIRLIAGSNTTEAAGSVLRAGVEIRLATGWKTYWRYPGDSGVPPHFDFEKSDNVKSVNLSWPAPQRITDSEGVTIGYKDAVVFPLKIEPKDATKPVVLRVKLDYAVCEKLCIPAQGQAELTLKSGHAETNGVIAAAEKKVPHANPLGANTPFSIKAFRRDDSAKPARVLVDVASPGGAPVTLFAEGPASDWALPIPEETEGAPAGLQRFSFALDGMPPGKSADGANIKLTAVSGQDAIETTIRLD
ncbi:protein-disulfide reductase DsbD domain-containing protein [Pseudorhodoplanes sinuspersici]|nr:protein-disulfide reductase DsbD domain-containing protein [Pseudorhodoplanes sinuspersici]RKE66052.1 DsbC/DsbD-like thiol-disulfide interchange protein [Pseudorhodoplanes sinuspersici]